MRRLLLALPLSALFASCALGSAPIRYTDICTFVRDAVRDGSFPLDLARARYPECNVVTGKGP